MTNQIHFNIKDGKVKVSHKDPLSIIEFMQVVSTGILSAMQSVVDKAPEDQKEEVRGDLYDMYNHVASNTLHYFAPEYELHPNLTTQAILKAENEIIEEEYKKVQKDPTYESPIKVVK